MNHSFRRVQNMKLWWMFLGCLLLFDRQRIRWVLVKRTSFSLFICGEIISSWNTQGRILQNLNLIANYSPVKPNNILRQTFTEKQTMRSDLWQNWLHQMQYSVEYLLISRNSIWASSTKCHVDTESLLYPRICINIWLDLMHQHLIMWITCFYIYI